jgi:hypothetical protein
MGLLAPCVATVVAVPVVLWFCAWPNAGDFLFYLPMGLYGPVFIWLIPAHYVLGPIMGISLRAIDAQEIAGDDNAG